MDTNKRNFFVSIRSESMELSEVLSEEAAVLSEEGLTTFFSLRLCVFA